MSRLGLKLSASLVKVRLAIQETQETLAMLAIKDLAVLRGVLHHLVDYVVVLLMQKEKEGVLRFLILLPQMAL
jgi:hypothetical protein